MLDRSYAKSIDGNVQSLSALVHVRQLVSHYCLMLVNAKAGTRSCVCYKSADRLEWFIRWGPSEPVGKGFKCEGAGLLLVDRSPALAPRIIIHNGKK